MAGPVGPIPRPYVVTYYKDGVKKTIRRVPPPKLHDMVAEDVVRFKEDHNDDWRAGKDLAAKFISSRHPNTIQVENSEGDTTFASYFELDLIEEKGPREDTLSLDRPKNHRYLLWP